MSESNLSFAAHQIFTGLLVCTDRRRVLTFPKCQRLASFLLLLKAYVATLSDVINICATVELELISIYKLGSSELSWLLKVDETWSCGF